MYKVLLVEDEEIIRKGLRYTFPWEESDCVVVGEAENGQLGMEKILELRPDIVITDIGMPVKNGIEMLRDTMEECSYCAIILSVYDEFALAKDALQLGVADYLVKPLEHKQLAKALARARTIADERRQLRDTFAATRSLTETELLRPELFLPSRKRQDIVNRMIAFIASNYKKKLTITDFCREFDMSDTSLNQKFKEGTGYTINDYVNRFRVRKAIGLLREGEGKITMIGPEVGFRDYKYFINVFKKYIGVTPSQFAEYLANHPTEEEKE